MVALGVTIRGAGGRGASGGLCVTRIYGSGVNESGETYGSRKGRGVRLSE